MRTSFPYSMIGQRGAAMMVMLVIMVLGALAFLVSALGSSTIKTTQLNNSATALAQAKEALIGYAVTYGDTNPNTHGYLPCPDANSAIGNEGNEDPNCGVTDANTIGRLPWKSLGLPPLHDGSGECLWYAVSGTYKNNPKTSTKMNWDNTGKPKVFSTDGNEIAANEIVAVVIAPGTVISDNSPAQDRSGAVAPICGGNYSPAAYLDNDTTHNINNSDIAAGKFILPHDHRANGNVTLTVNDQLVFITRQDIWSAIEKRIAQETRQCLDDYAASNGGRYPWAAPVTDTTFYVSTPNILFGRLPRHQPIADPDIIAMMDAMTALQVTVDNCKLANDATNRNALDNAGNDLENAAKTVRDNQPTTPAISSGVTTPAINAGNDAQDNSRCFNILNNPTGDIVQTNLDSATDAISALPPTLGWPVSCTLLTSTPWGHWRNMVFYQIADGFKPGSAASCGGSCLSVTGSGHTAAGSGSYHATVIAAGKKLTANRVITNMTDYLEADNLLPQADTTKPYKTYQVTDTNYATINDRVLCMDGGVNCK
jgi:type II secretory pathway pseudopilin PulG